MSVPNEHLLYLATVLFGTGVLGFLIRRNVIVVLMSVELMLSAANLAFLAGSRAHGTPGHPSLAGPLAVLFVIAVAAAEVAVGLALVIALYRLKQSVETESLSEMKG